MIGRRITRETAILAVGSAVALAAIDVVFVYRQVIDVIYLADAVAELGLVVWWTMTYVGVPRRRRPVDPLLARAQSVSQGWSGQRSGS